MLKTMEAAAMLHGCSCTGQDIGMEYSAILLGVRGNVVVCHGNADNVAVYKALLHARSRSQRETHRGVWQQEHCS